MGMSIGVTEQELVFKLNDLVGELTKIESLAFCNRVAVISELDCASEFEGSFDVLLEKIKDVRFQTVGIRDEVKLNVL